MKPEDCGRFDKCSAPICPLDDRWQHRKHLNGDRVCLYLTEAVKPAAEALFTTCGLSNLYKLISATLPQIAASFSPIRYALEKAAKTGSKMAHGMNLRNAMSATNAQ